MVCDDDLAACVGLPRFLGLIRRWLTMRRVVELPESLAVPFSSAWDSR
jgi:hypothetical protein